MTAISVLFCAAAFYFVYMLSSLAHTLRKGYPSFKGSQVLKISIKSGDKIFKRRLQMSFVLFLQVAEEP